MHCSDEDILAYLDGEVSGILRYRIRRHLESCWRCRTRLSAAEQQIEQLTKEVDDWSSNEQGWSKEGKQRLSNGIRAFEAALMSEKQEKRQWGLHPQWLLPATVLAAAMLVVIASRSTGHRIDAPVAAEEVSRAADAETALLTKPVHQSLAVEITQLRPVRKSRSTRLEVWTDRPNGRFASRWVSDDGVLRHAVWRPGRGVSDFLYSPAVTTAPVRRVLPPARALPLESLAEYGLDVTNIENAFLRSLEIGAGQPVSFTTDLVEWSHRNGTLFKAEKVETGGGPPKIRVTAQRTKGTMTVVLSVDFDAANYRPRLQSVRFETPERSVEFRIAATEIRRLSASEVKPSLFTPDMRSFGTMTSFGRQSMAEIPSVVPELPHVLPSAAPPRVDSALLKAHYELHEAGACLGEPVKIEQRDDGIRITNLSRGSRGESVAFEAQLEVVLRAFAELREAGPLHESMDADTGFGSVALRHSWALSRLARHFPPEQTQQMAPHQLRLLDTMMLDHVNVIEGALRRTHLTQKHAPAAGQAYRGWRESSIILYDTLLNARRLLRDEPLARIAPLLMDAQIELENIVSDFPSEYRRPRVAAYR